MSARDDSRAGGVAPSETVPSEGAAWRPTPAHLERARVLRFAGSLGCADVAALNALARRDPGAYWAAVERDLGIRWSRPYDRDLDLSEGKPFARFYAGGRMNYLASALDRWVETRPDAPALLYESEEGETRALTYRELHDEVGRAANALGELGVGVGDRVGIFMPLTPECAIATLACSRVGAIFTPIFSGYGAEAVASRLEDAGAKLLITADGFHRRGKLVAMKPVADEAAGRVSSVERVLVQRRVGGDVPWTAGRDVWWHEVVPRQSARTAPADTAAADPFMLIYTSGTTGRPKGAVHVQAGFPLKAAHDLAYCFDVQPGDRVLWYTDLGWMMGPWLIAGTLLLGATMVLYDGALDWPEADRIWTVVERQRATVLGIAPTAVRALMRQPVELVRRHDLSSLRALGSTGEPWNEDPWWWYFREVGGGRCPVVNYSGGTEIGGGIISGSTVLPCAPCAFAGPTPDMAADVVDETGQSLRGQVGELVIRQPWVGMTRGFWNDRERYLETYWSRFPDTWVHGDWARIAVSSRGARSRAGDDDGFWYIQGRSDDTIKVAGKRVGPAEVESAAVGHPAVAEAAAVGIPDDLKGEALLLFAVLRPAHEPSEGLRKEIAERVVRVLGPTLRPTVRFAAEIPKTRNAKVLRRLVRGAHLGAENLGDLSSLENPSAVEAIRRAR
ncbi:MAG TPA: AMP-binding protein [Chloroflexota bacterium]